MDDATRQAVQAANRLLHLIEACAADPSVSPDLDALAFHAIATLESDTELQDQLPPSAAALREALAELSEACHTANLSLAQALDLLQRQHPDLALAAGGTGVRCTAAGDNQDLCEGPEEAVRLKPLTGPSVTGCVLHGGRYLASHHGCTIEPGPDHRPEHHPILDTVRRSLQIRR
ncbi:hypothetical protein QIS99_31210 [Streptomyces sp. B-S-A8]|uniref:Uncharacterized protein n=1 Tax=Streptomyces solicavernae TaxID=3043614 RepID=A0ABT6S1R1_9ACTN|nr:hypothetical protein [Streptomyces sp. B-S-A8]MDI3390631.1 hypothetical protein [Streptomyces sp. B-S-A8]